MPTGAEETAAAVLAAGVIKLLDTASNAAQGVDVLVGWAKAQEGVRFNSHVFALPGSEAATADKEEAVKVDEKKGSKKPSASLASPQSRDADLDSASISMSTPVIFAPEGQIKSFLVIRAKGRDVTAGKVPGGIQLGSGLLQFALVLRQSAQPLYDNGQVILLNARGFDTAVGSQAEFEFSGQPWSSSRYLLTFHGQVNPLGTGFRRIAGGIIVDRRGELLLHGSWETGNVSNSASVNRNFSNNLPWKQGLGVVLEL
jgi:hypothetical protein